MAGKINIQIEKPDPQKHLIRYFYLTSYRYSLNFSKKTVGKIIGNKDGR